MSGTVKGSGIAAALIHGEGIPALGGDGKHALSLFLPLNVNGWKNTPLDISEGKVDEFTQAGRIDIGV